MRVRRPLFDNHPVEAPQRLNILVVGQGQLNWRAVLEFRVGRKSETPRLDLGLHKSSLTMAFDPYPDRFPETYH
ncbi:MAG: hypothetical protein ABIO96_06955 [Nitrospiraceae bacterium]